MQLRCNYHLSKWAEWHCPNCQRDFCRQCVPGGHDYKLRAGGPKCVLCLKKLEYLGSAVGAPRPAQQIINHLLFPFKTNALLVYVGLTLFTIPFLLLLQTPLIMFAVLPLIVLYTLVLEYAGAILLARSEGKKEPPVWGETFKGLEIMYLVKHVLTVAAGITVTNYAISVHPYVGFVVGAMALFILPAALIILTIDRSIARAINPLLLFSMVRPFLKDYCLFYGIALILATIFWQSLHTILNSGAAIFIVLWYVGLVAAVYACYAMLGYLMFYYQFDLHNSFVINKGPHLQKKEYETLRALGDSDVLLAEGRIDDARHVLKTTMDSTDNNREIHSRYHTILLNTNDETALVNHTNFYLNLVLSDGDTKAASQIFHAIRKRMPDFLPEKPDICIELAGQLKKELNYEGAIELLRSFHERFPNADIIPQAYQLAADILHHNQNESHRAAMLLKFIIDHFPNSEDAVRAKKSLTSMKGLL